MLGKGSTDHIRVGEGIEQELRRMRAEKMPVRGGGTPIYGEEGGDPIPMCDFRTDPMDMARLVKSKAVAARLAKANEAGVESIEKSTEVESVK